MNKKGNAVSVQKLSFLKSLSRGPVPWLAPLGIVLLLLFVYPTFEVLRYSFTDASILRNTYNYTLKSYSNIFSNPQTYEVLWITLVFVFFSVLFQTLLGLVTALAVDKGEELHLKGTVFIRVIILLSWAIPGIIIGIIWGFLYNETPTGILASFFRRIGWTTVTFLTNPHSALVCVIVANIWRGSAQSMILSYAGLKTIPKEMLEAGQIDGAGAWQRFLRIIMPSLFPVISTNVILNTILTFNTFDMVMSLSGGGPGRATEVLAMTSYFSIFRLHNLGRGSAYAVTLLFINACMAAVYFYILKKRGDNNL
ncbi:ABC transporter permease [Spirochaetia bacterium]|nr:ABC transporter permease [Spirochaetia bacterium]